MYIQQSAYKIEDGTRISVTSSAAQETGLGNGIFVSVSNDGDEVLYFNTNNETATTASMPLFIGETKSPIFLADGTINHKGVGSTVLVVNKLLTDGSA